MPTSDTEVFPFGASAMLGRAILPADRPARRHHCNVPRTVVAGEDRSGHP